MEVEEVPGAGGSGEGRGGDIPRGEYPPELLASQRTMEELGLPEALLAPLEDEVETSGPTTLLQAAILSEGRTGANLFVQVTGEVDDGWEFLTSRSFADVRHFLENV